jgi:hypothetical protein
MNKGKRQLVAVMNQISVVAPLSEMLIDVKAGANHDSQDNLCFEPFDLSNRGIVLARSINKMTEGKFLISVINYTDKPITLQRNLPLGMVYNPSEIHDDCTVNTFESSNSQTITPITKKALEKMNIYENLNKDQKKAINELLSKYSDVISQSSSDLG